ncbi:MAG: O-antigen ligase family protein [Acidobacteriota bacterium]
MVRATFERGSPRRLGAVAAGVFAACALGSTASVAGASSADLLWLLAALLAGLLCTTAANRGARVRLVLALLLAAVAADALHWAGALPVGVRSVATPAAPLSLFFDANERAAVLALFAPLLLGLGRPARAVSPLIPTALAVAVLATGSRGGQLALGFGLVTLLALRRPRRRRGRLVAATGIGLVAAAVAVPIAIPWVVLTAVSPSVDGTGLGGRAAIWSAAVRAVSELPVFGAGAGGFRLLVPVVIPYPPWTSLRPVDDAHALVLDLLLSAGVIGCGAALLAVGLLAGRLVAVLLSTPDTGRRHEASAWLATLGAHGLWSLGDSLPPGSPGFVVLCALLGLAHSFGRGPAQGPRHRGSLWPVLTGLAVGAVGLGLLAATPAGHDERTRRRAIVETLGSPRDGLAAIHALEVDCDHAFLHASLLRESRGDELETTRALETTIDCGPDDLGRLAALRPSDARLASRATTRWPTAADAWRWRVLAAAPGTLEQRNALWRVVALAPDDARSWLDLGDALAAAGDRHAALDAYAVSCQNGDPGANACLRGGRLAATLGFDAWARELHRASRWPPVRERAERRGP